MFSIAIMLRHEGQHVSVKTLTKGGSIKGKKRRPQRAVLEEGRVSMRETSGGQRPDQMKSLAMLKYCRYVKSEMENKLL